MTHAYLAGPVTNIKDYNYPTFHKVATELRATGLTVNSPAEDSKGKQINPADIDHTRSYSDFIREGIMKLLECEFIVLLPGWENSKGATLERDIASAMGMPILIYAGNDTTLGIL